MTFSCLGDKETTSERSVGLDAAPMHVTSCTMSGAGKGIELFTDEKNAAAVMKLANALELPVASLGHR